MLCLVSTDLQMPDAGGMAAIRLIGTTSPHIQIAVVTLFGNDDSVLVALQAGAHGYTLR